MQALREYLLRLLCAAFVCSILNRMAGNSGCKDLIRLLCGVFLTIVLILPLFPASIALPLHWTQALDSQASQIAAQGLELAKSQKEAIIRQQLEAYIISKAAQVNADVDVQVTMGEDLLPSAVTVTGRLSPAAKGKLKQMLTQDLGIPEVRQQWNG